MKILIVKTSSMGDVIHNLPIISDILRHHPDATIDWVVEDSFADILTFHPNINQILIVALRRWRKSLFSAQTQREIRTAIKQLRQQQYDAIIDTQGLLKSVLIAAIAHGTRHGRDWSSNREKAASIFYHKRHHVPYDQHTVGRNRQLSALALGYPNPTTAPEYCLPTDAAALGADQHDLSLPKQYVLGLHGTSRDAKLWPIEHWVSLGQYLNSLHFSLVLPWGSQAEFDRANLIASHLTSAMVLPKLGLKALTCICAKASASIGVDTGLVHLAVAVNTPSIAIYTDTLPTWNGAYADKHSIAINLGGVAVLPTPQQVITAFEKLAVS